MDSKVANVESATTSNEEQPPSYETLYGQIKEARETSSNIVTFVLAVIGIFLTTVAGTIVLGIIMIIPLTCIIIGATYLDDCPLERYIPIYLVVSGSVGLFEILLRIVKTTCWKKQCDGEEASEGAVGKLGTYLTYLIFCFFFAWFIAGNVWVYGSQSDLSSNPASANYCHSTAYYFAFWYITTWYIIIGLVILLMCCGYIYMCHKLNEILVQEADNSSQSTETT